MTTPHTADAQSLLHSTSDPTRDLDRDIDKAVGNCWVADGTATADLQAWHCRSWAQARAVIKGRDAPVATLAPAAMTA